MTNNMKKLKEAKEIIKQFRFAASGFRITQKSNKNDL